MKKLVCVLLALCLIAGMLAGCSDNSAPQSGGTDDAADANTPDTSVDAGQDEGDNQTSDSQGEAEIVLRMSQGAAVTGAIGQSMEHFSQLVAEKSDGRIQIDTYHNAQLGSERDNIEACQMGNLDLAVVNQAVLANFVPELSAVDLPYLIVSTDHADRVFLGETGDYFLAQLDAVGIKGLTVWESGFRNLTNDKREINSAADVEGLRIRVMENKIHQETWKQLGTDPVAMAWADAYTAMQQNAIDGQENPSSVIDANNVAEVNQYIAITEHAYSTVFIVMSPKTWDSLSAGDQELIVSCVLEAGLYERELNREMESAAVASLEEKGMTATYPDKEEFIALTQPVRDAYMDEFADIIAMVEAAK